MYGPLRKQLARLVVWESLKATVSPAAPSAKDSASGLRAIAAVHPHTVVTTAPPTIDEDVESHVMIMMSHDQAENGDLEIPADAPSPSRSDAPDVLPMGTNLQLR